MTNEEQIVIKDTVGVLEEIANIDTSKLSLKERIIMELYLRCGFEREMTLTELCYVLFDDFPLMSSYKKSGKRGHVYGRIEKLLAKHVITELKNPVRFKIRDNYNTRKYIQWILEKRYGIYVRLELI